MTSLNIEFKRVVPSLGLVSYQFSDGRSVYVDCNDGKLCFCDCHISKCEHFKLAKRAEISSCDHQPQETLASTQKRSRV